jgi:hypothetical protein
VGAAREEVLGVLRALEAEEKIMLEGEEFYLAS